MSETHWILNFSIGCVVFRGYLHALATHLSIEGLHLALIDVLSQGIHSSVMSNLLSDQIDYRTTKNLRAVACNFVLGFLTQV